MLSHHLKDVGSFIKVYTCEEDFVCKRRGITPRVGQHLELLVSLSEMKTLFKYTVKNTNKSIASLRGPMSYLQTPHCLCGCSAVNMMTTE